MWELKRQDHDRGPVEVELGRLGDNWMWAVHIFLPTSSALYEDMNGIRAWSLGGWEDVDGIYREKEGSRTSRFKREDYVLGFGLIGLEIIVMHQI